MIEIAKKIDLSSSRTFFGVWLCFTLAICFIQVVATYGMIDVFFPNLAAAHLSEILMLNCILALTIGGTSLFVFFLHFRHSEKVRSQLGHKVRHDSLTGLLSREAFLEDLHYEYERKQSDRDDALLVIDADYFKAINDTHGHIAGDEALVAITKALRKGIRESDKVGRLGGEEFAIHLKNVSQEKAKEIAERIRKNVKAASEELNIPDVRLSVSIGLVSYTENPEPIEVMAVADRLLYKAKEAGRDRVESMFSHSDTVMA